MEKGGLLAETETHEWFSDKIVTDLLRSNTAKEGDNSIKNLIGCVVREKSTGRYSHVLLDTAKNEVVYENGNIEAMGVYCDIMKVSKLFDQ